MSYGLNVQAVCDSNYCFLYFGLVAPGKCPDQKSFERKQLKENQQTKMHITILFRNHELELRWPSGCSPINGRS